MLRCPVSSRAENTDPKPNKPKTEKQKEKEFVNKYKEEHDWLACVS